MIKNLTNEINRYVSDEMTSHVYKDTNEAVIVISFDSHDIYKRYSNNNMLDSSLFEFIEESYKLVDDKLKSIKLRLSFSDDFTNVEKAHIESLIKLHFSVQILETKKSIKRTNIRASILLFIGALIMTTYGIFLALGKAFVIREIIGIFSWVFLWESCQEFFFSNSLSRLNLLKYIRLKNANIEYK